MTKRVPADVLRETVTIVQEHGGNMSAAAAAMGLNESTVRRRLSRASQMGNAPGHFENGVAPGYRMGKVTIARDADGKIERTWERQSPSEEAMLEAMEQVVQSMSQDLKRVKPVSRKAAVLNEDLCTLYTFTDYHVGMLAWHKEGGTDWDLSIAEDLGMKCMTSLVKSSPQSKRAVVNIQGDFLHWDGLMPVTPTHGHILDADGRFGKVVDVAIKLVRGLVLCALEKHDEVTLLICEGNHDIASSLWLRKLFALFYENEPRVYVHNSEIPYYALQWGKTMLGFHHGHMRNNAQLPELFAAQYREMWGKCPKVYIHVGHRHHKEVRIKDFSGARVIQHATLASRDAHAARGGWWSEREITAISYHRDFGYAGEVNITPEMVGYPE